MKKTENYAMPYPEQDDYFNVEDFQDMMVSVDNLMKKISDSGSQISSDAEHLYNQTKAQMDNIQKRMNTFTCLLYTSPSPRDISGTRMPSSA